MIRITNLYKYTNCMILSNIFKNHKGQGLLETVIALSIIITGLVGALSLAISNLANSSDSVARVIAGNLAREGVEIVRNIRDSNWLAGEQWDTGLFLSPPIDHTAIASFNREENGWLLEFGENEEFDEPEVLNITGDFLYNHLEGSPTNFYRLLTIDEICFDNGECGDGICSEEEGECLERIGARILSLVEWSERGRKHSLVIEDKLYDWR